MGTATVAPTAVTEQPDGQTIEVTFSGRFGFGIYRWAYLPFDVPAGVRQILVSTSHEGFALGAVARNVLDLGIFGPAGHELGNAAGFRGWSGGARDGFVISSAYATPGVATLRTGEQQVSTGTAVIDSLRAFGPSSMTFIVTAGQRLVSAKGTTSGSTQYAITVTGSGGGATATATPALTLTVN